VFAPDYPILTDRLMLRPFTPDDFEALHAIHSDEAVARYLYHEPRDAAETRALLAERSPMTRINTEGDHLVLAIERLDTGRMIGQAMLMYTSAQHEQGEIGYLLHPAHHRRGFASEAAVRLLRLAFEGMALHRVVARCDARNIASYRVMERAGMRREAHLRENEFVKGEWTDELIYAMLATEWRAAER
jgi:RimJ/RimL family protein N-acetyltransferase